jgi:hypothetical protein
MTGGTHTRSRTCNRTVRDPAIEPDEVPDRKAGRAAVSGLVTISYKFVQQLFVYNIIVDIY